MQLELASASLTQKRQLLFWEDSLHMAGDGTESGGLSHHGCPHLTQRSKVLEKPRDQPKVTQQLTPMPVTNMNMDGWWAPGRATEREASRVLRMEI